MDKIVIVVFEFSVFVAVFTVAIWLSRLVWNIVMPAVFNLSEISFWMAAGVIFLLGFLGGVIRR